MNRLPEWYTAEMYALDAALKGVWWRCPKHGVLADPVVLGGDVQGAATAYCADPECVERAVLVSRVEEGPEFNPLGGARRGRNRFATRGATHALLERITIAGVVGVTRHELLELTRGEHRYTASNVDKSIHALVRHGLIEAVGRATWRATGRTTNGAKR